MIWAAAPALHAKPPTLIALVLFTLVSLGLGVVANLAAKKGSFLKKYFLGNRSLGAFSVALTAAVMSGGTFMGFPSLVYSFGWVVGLWICSYMVAPLTILGILGKRIGQLSRRTGRDHRFPTCSASGTAAPRWACSPACWSCSS